MKFNQNIVWGLVLAAIIALFAVHAFLVIQTWQLAHQTRTDLNQVINFINQASNPGAGVTPTPTE